MSSLGVDIGSFPTISCEQCVGVRPARPRGRRVSLSHHVRTGQVSAERETTAWSRVPRLLLPACLASKTCADRPPADAPAGPSRPLGTALPSGHLPLAALPSTRPRPAAPWPRRGMRSGSRLVR
jgi:hypothetical protein